MTIAELLAATPVVPVLVVPEAGRAVPLARALARGGLGVVEITLRTAAALESIRRIAAELPEVTVGAGTVTRPRELSAVCEAGARFAVSPGLTPPLAAAAAASDLPFLPGVTTTSEVLAARDHGFAVLKLTPIVLAGGVALLETYRGLFPDLLFCPTGGLDAGNFRDYLAQPNVLCVGGSWVAPRAAVAAGDWDAITELAREAASARA